MSITLAITPSRLWTLSAHFIRLFFAGGAGLAFLLGAGPRIVGQPQGCAAECQRRSRGPAPVLLGQAPLARTIRVNQSHLYSVQVANRQYLRVVVEQQGADVRLRLCGANRRCIAESDSPNGAHGPEPVSFIAAADGLYTLEVSALAGENPGHYTIRIADLRQSTATDERRVAAERAFMEGLQLSLGETAEAFAETLKKFGEAAAIHRVVGDREGEATVLSQLGFLYLGADSDTAIKHLEQALALWRALGRRREEAATLYYLGVAYRDLGKLRDAADSLEKALGIRRNIKDRVGQAETLNVWGTIYFMSGDKDQALDMYRQALTLHRELGNRDGMAASLNNIAVLYDDQGNKRKTLEHYLEALPLVPKENSSGKAVVLNNIGTAYIDLGEYERGIRYLNQALAYFAPGSDNYNRAAVLNNIGRAQVGLGRVQQAIESYNAALALLDKTKDPYGRALTLTNIADLHSAQDQGRRALEVYGEALALWEGIGDSYGKGRALSGVAASYADLGEARRALDEFAKALELHRLAKDRRGEARTLFLIGRTYESLGDQSRALEHYRKAVSVEEDIRIAAGIDEVKVRLFEQSTELFRRTALLQSRVGQKDEAFNTSETARSRTFLDQMGAARFDFRRGARADLVAQEQAARVNLERLESEARRERAKPQPERNVETIQAFEQELAVRRSEYEELLRNIKISHPEYASIIGVAPLKLPDVQKLLGEDTTLLSYFVTSQNTLAFVITRDSFHAFELGVGEEELRQSALRFRDSFANLRAAPTRLLEQLHAKLIHQLRPYLKTTKLGIIPHGPLHYLPFAALHNGREYLGDEFALFYLPSASVLAFVRPKAGSDVSAMLSMSQGKAEGLPVLQYADAAAAQVARLYQVPALTNRAATETALRSRAGDNRVVFLAAHGRLNKTAPLFSQILLAPDKSNDGSLAVHEVYGLDLTKTDLVVLSGCQTQLGGLSQGDDLVGLNRAFFHAGASTVVASLWSVKELPTGELMTAFFRNLKADKSKAEALQAAQKEARAKYPHPYYWAAFVLNGDPGVSSGGVR